MSTRQDADQKLVSFFEDQWRKGDPWDFDSSPWERLRLDRLHDVIAGHSYGRVLEIGCGAGHFTERVLPLAQSLVGLDVSPTAVEKARARVAASPFAGRADLRVQNVLDLDLRSVAPLDLILLSETVYFLGWLYPFFNVVWLARDLFESTAPGGRLLLANTLGEIGDALVLPFVVRSYHDLFRNVGYEIESEQSLRGEKNGVEMEVLISLLRRPD